jgi:hypothetical protein
LELREEGFTCSCGMCQFEKDNPAIVDPAIELARKIQDKYDTPESKKSRKAVKELKNARARMYELFDERPREYDLLKVETIPSDTPRQFTLARLLKIILQNLVRSLREQKFEAESIPFCTELYALIKGNLNFSVERLEPHIQAMCIWNYHCLQVPVSIHSPAATMWAKKVKEIVALVAGKKYFASKGWAAQIDEVEQVRDGMGDKEIREVARKRKELPCLV